MLDCLDNRNLVVRRNRATMFGYSEYWWKCVWMVGAEYPPRGRVEIVGPVAEIIYKSQGGVFVGYEYVSTFHPGRQCDGVTMQIGNGFRVADGYGLERVLAQFSA